MMGKSKVINIPDPQAPDRETARQAVRTLIRWAGDDPDRPGMAATPDRVLDFYTQFFTGYAAKAEEYSASTADALSYDDAVLIKDIPIASFCEHHMLPAAGHAHIAYIPGKTVAGIGTLARIAKDCAARFTTQEAITTDIINMIEQSFAPQGIAVTLRLNHGCMGLRAAEQRESTVITSRFSGLYSDNSDIQTRYFMAINERDEKK
ncbi:MAG: GTP cyclohydrolase I FolE [Rhodospirillales bacterium]|nr:GTP cyclohydrolase I FolE [Rhodospirillales bacterium]MCB9996102.1 GTP cyclohydrolase I FolE [Rhodospirillales bacterium]